MRRPLFAFLAVFAAAAPALAQSPENSTLVVVVEDDHGAVVPDARVSLVNPATGLTRDAISGERGSAALTALPLTGRYRVTVS